MLVKHLSCWHYNPRSDSHNFRDDDHLGQDGAVLDEGVVVGGRLLVDDCHDPLQNRMLQLQITLEEEDEVDEMHVEENYIGGGGGDGGDWRGWKRTL